MNSLKVSLVLSLILISTGCSVGPSFNETAAPATRQDTALVYVYRVGKGLDLSHGSINITVDGNDVVSIDNEGFTSFYLKPGPHLFVAKWSIMSKPRFEGDHFDPKRLSISLEAGKKYYINYFIHRDSEPNTILETNSLVGKAFSKTHIISAGLILENERTGLANLSICSYQNNDID